MSNVFRRVQSGRLNSTDLIQKIQSGVSQKIGVGFFERVLVNYTLTGETGTFSQNGTSVNLKSDRRAFSASQSFSLSSNSTALRKGSVLTTSLQIFSTSFISSGLYIGKRLLTIPVSFNLSGVLLSLVSTRVLFSQKGSYVYTGNSAFTKFGRSLSGDVQNYDLSGKDILLKTGAFGTLKVWTGLIWKDTSIKVKSF